MITELRLTKVHMLAVIKIFEHFFLRPLGVFPQQRKTELQSEFGMLLDAEDIDKVISIARLYQLNSLGMNLTPNSEATHSFNNKFINIVFTNPQLNIYKHFASVALNLLINLYVYGYTFFTSPFQNPDLLQEFLALQQYNAEFQDLNWQLMASLSTEGLRKKYRFAITGRYLPLGPPEHSFSKENSNELRELADQCSVFSETILLKYTRLAAMIQKFNHFRLRSPLNAFYKFVNDEQNYRFLLTLFGEWGVKLNATLEPVPDIMKRYKKYLSQTLGKAPSTARSSFLILMNELATIPKEEGVARMRNYFETEPYFIKWFLLDMNPLITLSACYYAYQQLPAAERPVLLAPPAAQPVAEAQPERPARAHSARHGLFKRAPVRYPNPSESATKQPKLG